MAPLLGILDWGIGGISVYKLVKQRRPDVPVLYFSDTGTTPYGKMGRKELVGRLDGVIEFMKSKGMTHLAIGCNAASTAIPHLADHGIEIEGVIEPAVATTVGQKPRRLGLIGGRRTVLSGVYRSAFANHDIEVDQRIAQPLSGLIESGDVSSEKLRIEAAKILRPLKNCSHILLACTHYPAIASVLKDFVSAETAFIDPAESIVQRITKWRIRSGGPDVFYTTGDPEQMKRSAALAFGVKVGAVRKVSI